MALPDPPRVVLDTNVALALFAWCDPGCAALAAALHEGRLRAVASAATRAEWLRVLQRDALRLDPASRVRAGQWFQALVIDWDTDPQPGAVALPRCRDRDDQMFLELARDCGAGAVYTRDRELLKLSRRTQHHAGFVVLPPEACRA